MPVIYSRSVSIAERNVTLWADDYIAAQDNGILPYSLELRGFRTYVKAEHVNDILKFGLDGYLDALREHWYEALGELVEQLSGSFDSVKELALWMRHTAWYSTYPAEVSKELAKGWVIASRKSKATMANPVVQVNGLEPIDEEEDAAKKRKAAHQQMLGKLRPFPLPCVWKMYHDKHIESGDYSARLSVLEDDISDIAKFYQVFNNYPFDQVKIRDTIHFFHHKVKPVWEDAANVDGGSWTFRVPKAKAYGFFHETLLLCMDGEADRAIAIDDRVVGVSYSMRFNTVLISVWNRRGANQKSVEALKDFLIKRMSPDLRPTVPASYFYKKHSEHDSFEDIIKKANRDKEEAKEAVKELKEE